MKRTKRVSFSANALRHKHRASSQNVAEFNWNVLTAISTTALAFISLLALGTAVLTVKYAAHQIEEFRRESQTQHFIEKASEFDSSQFRAVRRALAEKRLNSSRDGLLKLDVDDAPTEMFDELDFCNNLGILMRHGQLSAYDAWGEFSFWLFPFYTDAEDLIKADQKDAPASWSNCSYLMEQVKTIDKQEDSGKQLNPTQRDIMEFYDSELDENQTSGGGKD